MIKNKNGTLLPSLKAKDIKVRLCEGPEKCSEEEICAPGVLTEKKHCMKNQRKTGNGEVIKQTFPPGVMSTKAD